MTSMRSITTWTFEPEEPLELAAQYAEEEGTTLFHSAGTYDSVDSSFLALFPDAKIVLKARKGCWEELQKKLGPFNEEGLSIPKWVGYLGYEMGHFTDEVDFPHLATEIPDALFFRPTVLVHFNHKTHQATLYAHKPIQLKRKGALSTVPPLKSIYASDTRESYLAKIRQIKEWILDGEIYQLNLSQEFHWEGKTSPFFYFRELISHHPTPFACYMNCETHRVVSASPERFLARKGARLETRPIKGTAPRGMTPHEDQKFKHELLNSEKERAELLMITDLMRNDLGKVSETGSVRVKELQSCEAYATVFHLSSLIESTAKVGSLQVLYSLFPGGSITGCPKLRAMEKIAAIEKRRRGIYTGSLGYFAENGNFDFNIAIRTLVVYPSKVELQLGGGIVADSDPGKEYEETLHKGRAFINLLGKP